jgi:hypothetical protein
MGEMELVLDSRDFEVLFQVSKELPNLADFRLESLCLTRDDVRGFVGNLRDLRVAPVGQKRVKILVSELARVSRIRSERDPNVSGEQLALSQLVTAWASWLGVVVEALGERELFLRTGFEREQVMQVIDRLQSDGILPGE